MFDLVRLSRERQAVMNTFGGAVPFVRFVGTTGGLWSDYGVCATHLGFQLLGCFHRDHPYRPPRFTIAPAPQNRHYYDDGQGMHLCYCRGEEWNPDWTMATALGIVYRFLSAYRTGEAS